MEIKTFIDWLTEHVNSENDTPFTMSKDDVLIWIKRIQNDLIGEGKKPYIGKHYGDCTKQNISCQICVYQTWLEKYKEYTTNFFNN